MEAKLAEYRARKRKEALFNMVTLKSNWEKSDIPQAREEDECLSESSLISQTSEGAESTTSDIDTIPEDWSWLTIISYVLYILLWATLYAIAIQMEFGTVFLVVSILYGIWRNTRTGPKKQGEVSAYSVFNPNCEAIDGTLKAEQFEREIRYGAGSVH
ncbi:SAYSvFN domain-containing protein 1 [Blattella germanica]|nr:SAYSvFN domain-containing protein 1 [Blattella germanica]